MVLASNSVGFGADPVKIVFVLGKPAGYPTSHPAEAPKETTPICFHFCPAAPSLTSNFMFNGPPESPLHVPFPPAVSEGFPHPVAVTSSLGSAVSPTDGRQLGLM